MDLGLADLWHLQCKAGVKAKSQVLGDSRG